MPDEIAFATKNDIALAQVKQALAAGVRPGIVLADPAYGDSAAFRDQLTEWGLLYAVGIRSVVYRSFCKFRFARSLLGGGEGA